MSIFKLIFLSTGMYKWLVFDNKKIKYEYSITLLLDIFKRENQQTNGRYLSLVKLT